MWLLWLLYGPLYPMSTKMRVVGKHMSRDNSWFNAVSETCAINSFCQDKDVPYCIFTGKQICCEISFPCNQTQDYNDIIAIQRILVQKSFSSSGLCPHNDQKVGRTSTTEPVWGWWSLSSRRAVTIFPYHVMTVVQIMISLQCALLLLIQWNLNSEQCCATHLKQLF